MKLKSIKIWILALLITGCTSMCDTAHKDMNPEEVVEEYTAQEDVTTSVPVTVEVEQTSTVTATATREVQ